MLAHEHEWARRVRASLPLDSTKLQLKLSPIPTFITSIFAQMIPSGVMPAPTTILSFVVIILVCSLDLALFGLVFRKKLHRKLTVFAVYFILMGPWQYLWVWASNTPKLYEVSWIYFYWASQFVFSVLRLLAIMEICWRALHEYSVVWKFTVRTLGVTFVFLLLWTTSSAIRNSHVFQAFISKGLQRFEFTQAVLLLAILFVGSYYNIIVPPLYRWMLAGSGVFSSIQVANYQLGLNTKYPPNSIFDFVGRYSFAAVLMLWTWAIWRWADDSTMSPKLISQQSYDELSPQIHNRLRGLNDRLAGLLDRRT